MVKFKNCKQYSEEYDLLMNLELQIVKNAYNYEYDKKTDEPIGKDKILQYPKYSIKLPNLMTGLEIHTFMDGDQPGYHATEYLNILEAHDFDADQSLADYPRHGNTKRIFYHDKEKAQAALYVLKKHNADLLQREVA